MSHIIIHTKPEIYVIQRIVIENWVKRNEICTDRFFWGGVSVHSSVNEI